MSAGLWRTAQVRHGILAALLVALGIVTAVPAPAAAADEYVKYYTVTAAYQGAPENLRAIAIRFLGNANRGTEIFNLNVGRTQPDGAALSDPTVLHAGWHLVLPWDAVGTEVQYGLLPKTAPQPSPGRSSGTNPTPGATNSASPGPQPGATSGSPSPGGTSSANGRNCVKAIAASDSSNWAMVRLAPEQAWTRSRGRGQLVAIIDSGVDGTLTQLSGRVSAGANIVTGGQGNTDCLGSGTAMAGLVAAQPASTGGFAGVAPEAVVMPVRVVTDSPEASAANQATAIEVAVSAGATVLALGGYLDPDNPTVAQAIKSAVEQGVVVVAGAPVTGTTNERADLPDEVIRVAGVGVDGKAVAEYVAGAIDVVAPGVNVTSIGITGTKGFVGSGTQYAVALVAGEAALVRSAYPDLSPAQVATRIKMTADSMGDAQPDGRYGHGMINPATSVTRELSEEAQSTASDGRPAADPAGTNDGKGLLFLFPILAVLALAALVTFRIRRTLGQKRGGDDDVADGSEEAPAPAAAGRPEEEEPKSR
ncbi:S8 family serine peptidase [Micromonospora sp. NPDC003197]